MRKTILLPAPQLSCYKEVNVDLDMTGAHYILLSESKGRVPEEVALSIVRDLMEEDANKLTINDLRYVFTLIKINSLENDYSATVRCTIVKPGGAVCGHENTCDVRLSDSDLNCAPDGYAVPEISLYAGGKERKFKVMPPTCDIEIGLYDYFTTKKGKTAEELNGDSSASMEFALIRAVCHLVGEDGERLIDDLSKFDGALDVIRANKFAKVTELLKLANEVGAFGVQNKEYTIVCKECGGTLRFRLPFLHGLVG